MYRSTEMFPETAPVHMFASMVVISSFGSLTPLLSEAVGEGENKSFFFILTKESNTNFSVGRSPSQESGECCVFRKDPY